MSDGRTETSGPITPISNASIHEMDLLESGGPGGIGASPVFISPGKGTFAGNQPCEICSLSSKEYPR